MATFASRRHSTVDSQPDLGELGELVGRSHEHRDTSSRRHLGGASAPVSTTWMPKEVRSFFTQSLSHPTGYS